MAPYDQPYGGTMQLIKNLTFNTFAILHVQVVKYYDVGPYVTLDVTDYTRNEQLPEFTKNAYNSQAIEGKFTLRVECHKQNADFARKNARVARYLRLRNCRIKMSSGGMMEGNIWGDKRGTVDIEVLEDRSAIREIEGRRRGLAQPPSGPSKDRKRKQEPPSNFDRPPSSRGRSKSQKSVEVDDVSPDKGNEESPRRDGPDIKIMPHLKLTRDASVADATSTPFKELLVRKCICQHSTGKNLKIAPTDDDHCCLPYLNVLHKVIMRIIDYHPHDLRDFTVFEDGRWKWHFSLFVVDGLAHPNANDAVQLLLMSKDAEVLLGLPPTAFRNNPGALEMLKFSLALLWGNLSDDKDAWLARRGQDRADTDLPVYACPEFPEGFVSKPGFPFVGCVAEVGLPLDDDRDTFRRALFLRHVTTKSTA